MIIGYRHWAAVLAAVAGLLFVQSQASYAGLIGIGNGQVLNITEGSSANLIFGVMNTGPNPLTFMGYQNTLQRINVGGDLTDDFNATFTGPNVGAVIPVGLTVSLIYQITTPATTGEVENFDAGLWLFAPGPGQTNLVTATDNTTIPATPFTASITGATINVLDPPQPIPEPATLLLFGTTAAGLGLARWRRLGRKQRL